MGDERRQGAEPEREFFDAWITKYALTSGIKKMTVAQSKWHPSMVSTYMGYAQYFHTEGKDWHRTEEAAIARAEQMRAAKIASLEKQINKLKAIQFGGSI